MASLEELHELLQDGIVRWPLVAAMDNLQRTGQRGRLVYLLQGTLEELIITLKELVAKEKAIVDRQGSRHGGYGRTLGLDEVPGLSKGLVTHATTRIGIG